MMESCRIATEGLWLLAAPGGPAHHQGCSSSD